MLFTRSIAISGTSSTYSGKLICIIEQYDHALSFHSLFEVINPVYCLVISGVTANAPYCIRRIQNDLSLFQKAKRIFNFLFHKCKIKTIVFFLSKCFVLIVLAQSKCFSGHP